MEKINMQSLIDVLVHIEKQGFTSQFEVNGKYLVSLKTGNHSTAQEIRIVHFYRFEGESSPEDNAIMYAIETSNNEKGTLVDGYSNAADPSTSDFIREVNDIHK